MGSGAAAAFTRPVWERGGGTVPAWTVVAAAARRCCRRDGIRRPTVAAVRDVVCRGCGLAWCLAVARARPTPLVPSRGGCLLHFLVVRGHCAGDGSPARPRARPSPAVYILLAPRGPRFLLVSFACPSSWPRCVAPCACCVGSTHGALRRPVSMRGGVGRLLAVTPPPFHLRGVPSPAALALCRDGGCRVCAAALLPPVVVRRRGSGRPRPAGVVLQEEPSLLTRACG